MFKRENISVLVSVALSLDGYLNDSSGKRLILSNEEDLYEIDKLRASYDAIVVGAETYRRDLPSLKVKSPKLISARVEAGLSEQPLRVVLSNSLRLDGFVVLSGSPQEILSELQRRSIKRVMIEGGAKVIASFLEAGLVDQMRVAIAPVLVAEPGAPRLFSLKPDLKRFHLAQIHKLGDMAVLNYELQYNRSMVAK